MKKAITLSSVIFFATAILSSCAPNDLNTALKDTEQNVLSYLDPDTENQPLIPEEKQKALMEDYLVHYFSPWENKDRQEALKIEEKIKETQFKLLNDFQKNPGWGQNHQPHPASWIENIEKNMDLETFPNDHQKAITTENSNLRMLPSRRPSFLSLKEVGQGFPFDSLQTTFLPANLPVLILHTSKDKAWRFIVSHNAFGWMPSNQVALVNETFISQWKTGRYLTPSVLEAPLKSKSGQFHFYLRLGQIYPAIHSTEKDFYILLIAQKDLNNRAVIRTVPIEEKLMYETPIPITPYHIALLANEMMGQPYGWGGLFGHRDCSSTMADLFAPFGIWLPRNSRDQLHAWKFISLEGLKNSEKKKLIEQKGVPMLTMIGWPGHIMLYLGTHNNQIYTFHTAWGLQTTLLSGKTGRAIFGKTVISPLDLGSEYFNIKATLLDKAAVMTFLGEKGDEDNNAPKSK